MNCEQVERRLSEYLDKSLEPAAGKAIDSHLAACSRCRAEADLLAGCIRQVAALSEVEPPIGFAQRVIAHVKEIEAKPGFWEGLFLPLKVNVPIQATALVLIGIITIYIVAQEPHRRMMAPSSRTFYIEPVKQETASAAARNESPELLPKTTTVADEASSKPIQAPVEDSAEKPGTASWPHGQVEPWQPRPAEEEVFPSPTPQYRLAPRTAPRVGAAPRFTQPEIVASPDGRPQTAQKAKLTPTIPVVSDPKARSVPPGHTTPVPIDLLEMMGAGAPGPPLLPSEFPQVSAAPDVELIIRQRPLSSSQNVKDSGSAMPKSAAGARVGEQTGLPSIDRLLSGLAQSATRQTVWLSIPHNQYDRVRNDLLAIGTIESESRKVSGENASALSSESQLRVMVIILPAEDAGANRPVALPSR